MAALSPEDRRSLLAAQGWLELGLPAEAEAELDAASSAIQDSEELLLARWEVRSVMNRWDDAIAVARKLLERFPESPAGPIQLAYSLRRSHNAGLDQAWEALHPALDRFPTVSTIPYNLACYAAQSGRLDEAMDWLARAIQIEGRSDRIKQMALGDDDLKALWGRIRKL